MRLINAVLSVLSGIMLAHVGGGGGRAIFYRSVLPLLAMLFAVPSFATSKNIWISACEIAQLPTTGAAWSRVVTDTSSWDSPSWLNTAQSNIHPGQLVASAMVAVRLNNPVLKGKVRDGILEAKRLMDSQAEYDGNTNTLSVGRHLGGYVVAADIIDLEAFDPTADAEFRPWLSSIRYTVFINSNSSPSHGLTLLKTHQNGAHNWSAWCGASLAAAARYLGEQAPLDSVWLFFRAYSDRSLYPIYSGGPGNQTEKYFARTGSWSTSWTCSTTATWKAINDNSCIEFGNEVGGAIVEDIGRGVEAWPPDGTASQYQWQSTMALYMQAEILHRAGYASYAYANSMLKRVMDFNTSWSSYQTSMPKWVPYLANNRYGTSYTTEAPSQVGATYSAGYTYWTHPAPSTAAISPFTAYSIYPYAAVTFAPPIGAQEYDIRYSQYATPITEGNFGSMAQVTNEPFPCTATPFVPVPEQFSLEAEMAAGDSYHVAIKYKNSAGAWSSMASDTVSLPLGGGGGGCGECLEESARRSREEGGEIKQTMFTVAQAKGRTDLYDVLGRKARSIRPGVYVQHITNAKGVVIEKRRVVVVR